MKRLNDNDLQKVEGGMSVTTAIGIGLVVTFLAGILDGIARPLKCNS